jgi:hypothetical protein
MRALTTRVRGRIERWRWPGDAKIVFLHMPKCGGTTVSEALLQAFPPDRIEALQARESLRAAELCRRDYAHYCRDLLAYRLVAPGRSRLLTGHWVVDGDLLASTAGSWKFVTVLRDPVERWISSYFYNRFKQSEHFRIDCDLDEFLDRPRSRHAGETYVRHLTGVAFDDEITDESVNAACETLSRFCVVGVLSQLDAFVDQFAERIGIRLNLGSPQRPGPVAPSERTVSDEQRARIVEYCQPDLAVFRAAEQLVQGESLHHGDNGR